MKLKLKELFQRAESWPKEAQERLIRAADAIEAEQDAVYRPTRDELHAIDEGLEQFERGEMASAAEVEAAFAKFRSA